MLNVDPMVIQITCFPSPQLQPRAGSEQALLQSLPFLPHFWSRVKAKKGVTLLGTKSRSGQWRVTSELLTGAKHSTATVDVAWAQGTPLPPW